MYKWYSTLPCGKQRPALRKAAGAWLPGLQAAALPYPAGEAAHEVVSWLRCAERTA